MPFASLRGGVQFAKLSECISWIPVCADCKMDQQFNNSSLGFRTKKANITSVVQMDMRKQPDFITLFICFKATHTEFSLYARYYFKSFHVN